jgi:hypothetical protein
MSRRRISPLAAVITGGFMVLMAVGFFAGSVYTYFHARSFLQTAVKAEGTVVKLVEEPGSGHGPSYFPVFKFTDSQGWEQQANSKVGSNPPSYKVGDKVNLLYDPNDPTSAVTDTFWGVWIWPVALCGAGVFDLVFAFLFVFVAMRQQGRV